MSRHSGVVKKRMTLVTLVLLWMIQGCPWQCLTYLAIDAQVMLENNAANLIQLLLSTTYKVLNIFPHAENKGTQML